MTLKEHLDDILAECEFEGSPVPGSPGTGETPDSRDARGAHQGREAHDVRPAVEAPARA